MFYGAYVGRADRTALPVRARPRLHDLRLLAISTCERGGHDVAHRGRGHGAATTATGPAPRWCSSTAPTSSRRSPGPDRQLLGFARVELDPGEAADGPVRRRSEPAGVLRPRDALRVRARRAPLRGRLVVGGPAARGGGDPRRRRRSLPAAGRGGDPRRRGAGGLGPSPDRTAGRSGHLRGVTSRMARSGGARNQLLVAGAEGGAMLVSSRYRLVTRSDFDGLVCAVLLKELDLIDDISFVHPKDMQDGVVPITDRDITTNLPVRRRRPPRVRPPRQRDRPQRAAGEPHHRSRPPRRRPGSSTTSTAARAPSPTSPRR